MAQVNRFRIRIMREKTFGLAGFSALRGILLALMTAALVSTAVSTASAQDRQIKAMNDRITSLENQLRSLTRYLSNNPDAQRSLGADAGAAPSTDQLANLDVRLSALENQLRSLTGQVEEAQHQAQIATDRLDRLQARLDQLQGGAPAAAAATGQTTTPAPADTGASDETVEVTQAPGTAQPLPSGDPTALYNAALARLRQEDYRGAANGFEEFLTRYKDNELAANAQYWLGESYYAQQDYSSAARAFLTAYSDYPKSSKASGALLKLGISLGELNQKQDACAALREFGQKYPNASPVESNRAAVARKKLGCS